MLENLLLALALLLIVVFLLLRFSLWFARWQNNRRGIKANLESMAQETRLWKISRRQIDWRTRIP